MQQTQQQQQKQYIFYDTIVTRNNILSLIKLQDDKELFKKYIDTKILCKWDTKDSSATRNEVFLDFSEYLWLFMINQHYSVEQKSTIFSIAIHVFIDSLDKKKTQTESFSLLQVILNAQTLVTNNKHLPIFNTKQTQIVEKFFKEYFYKYYSLYEITMTKFIDINIYTQNSFNYTIPQSPSLQNHEEKDPQTIPALAEYLFAEEFAEGDEEDNEQDMEGLEGEDDQNFSQNQSYVEDGEIQPFQSQLDNLQDKDKELLNYVDNKIQDFNKTLENTKTQEEEMLEQNVELILNPPKKK